ncbi:hypothetical protein Gorai_019328 [Gossypium raimondii]|uniref:Uncharacterized protein n=1 Tax=Gossypium raimondii TaxID=29730 RepID=A0A7J8PP32_GOSRA|nr:hypothetical protein [Gossypium raimondii]
MNCIVPLLVALGVLKPLGIMLRF